MQGKARYQKPSLILELDKVTRRRRLSKINEVVKKINIRLESCWNVEPSVSPLLEILEVEPQLVKEATSSKLSDETLSETYTFGEEILIGTDRKVGEDTPVILAEKRGMDLPPIHAMPPIDPFVRPRGLPIVILQNLAAVDMSSHLPKFCGTRNEDPSRHMERYIKMLASILLTNPGYWLVWFLATLESEAYE